MRKYLLEHCASISFLVSQFEAASQEKGASCKSFFSNTSNITAQKFVKFQIWTHWNVAQIPLPLFLNFRLHHGKRGLHAKKSFYDTSSLVSQFQAASWKKGASYKISFYVIPPTLLLKISWNFEVQLLFKNAKNYIHFYLFQLCNIVSRKKGT